MSNKTLNLTVPEQLQVNWCWAATTIGVNHFYDPLSALTQCGVVNRRLGRNDCCVAENDTLPAACNVQAGLTLPLYEADHHKVTYANKLSFEEIASEIESDRPVCVRVVWEQGFGEGHFAVIVGIIREAGGGVGGEAESSNEIMDLVIEDSLYRRSTHTYEAFSEFYLTPVQTPEEEQEKGVWTHSYYTQLQSADASGSEDQGS